MCSPRARRGLLVRAGSQCFCAPTSAPLATGVLCLRAACSSLHPVVVHTLGTLLRDAIRKAGVKLQTDSLSQPIQHCCIQYNRIQQLYFSSVATILDVLAALSRLYHELRVWYDVPKATEVTIWAYAGPLASTIPN